MHTDEEYEGAAMGLPRGVKSLPTTREQYAIIQIKKALESDCDWEERERRIWEIVIAFE